MYFKNIPISEDILNLPYYTISSLYRMFFAYLLSLAFAFSYGYIAATNRKLELTMLTTLDVLQSVPILGFFPVALFFFVGMFKNSTLGLEIAAIFLIFTCMAWNEAYGVYESIKTIPSNIQEMAISFKISGWLKFRKIIFPACARKIIYNGMLSWAGGWFFIIAAEIITTGDMRLVGLGRFLIESAWRGDLISIFIGIIILITVILLMDIFIWIPLQIWADKFKYETTGEMPPLLRPMLTYRMFRWFPGVKLIRKLIKKISILKIKRIVPVETISKYDIWFRKNEYIIKFLKYINLSLFMVIFLMIIGSGLYSLIMLFFQPLPPDAFLIPIAIFYSSIRILIAYIICVAWTLPVAVYLYEHKKVEKYALPIAEISAAIPATALFPVIILLIIQTVGNVDLATIILLLPGMQWYLFFNIIAGLHAIPADIKDTAKAFHIKGKLYWKRVIFPAILPSFITGSVTAWGGGWNTVIVSEYIQFGGTTYGTMGIGYLLSRATFEIPNTTIIILSVTAMIIVLLLMNKLLWRPLYKKACENHQIES